VPSGEDAVPVAVEEAAGPPLEAVLPPVRCTSVAPGADDFLEM